MSEKLDPKTEAAFVKVIDLMVEKTLEAITLQQLSKGKLIPPAVIAEKLSKQLSSGDDRLYLVFDKARKVTHAAMLAGESKDKQEKIFLEAIYDGCWEFAKTAMD